MRNIAVLCDGTGNIWGSNHDTNVVKMARAIVKRPDQLVFYDPGVGTSTAFPSMDWIDWSWSQLARVWGLAYGRGIYRNIAEAYEYLVENYAIGDRIYCFGFSRGAFTARSVAGMVNLFGVIRPSGASTIPLLVRTYFAKPDARRDAIARQFRECFAVDGRDARVHFVGVWDTVETVGALWSTRQTISSSKTIAGKRFDHVRHAVAVDEYRAPYRVRLYEGEPDAHQTLKQVWFPGAHSDVGGSYENDALANVTFQWMAKEAAAQGLALDEAVVAEYRTEQSPLLHDQAARMPLWAFGGLRARKPPEGALLHRSVGRIEQHEAAPLRSDGRLAMLAIAALFAYALQSALGGNELANAQLATLGAGTSGDPGRAGGALWAVVAADFLLIAAYAGLFASLAGHAFRTIRASVPSVARSRAVQLVPMVSLIALVAGDGLENLLTLFTPFGPWIGVASVVKLAGLAGVLCFLLYAVGVALASPAVKRTSNARSADSSRSTS